MSTTQNEANVQRPMEAWTVGDLNGYLELYVEGIGLHGYSPEPMDKTAVRAFYGAVFAAFDSPQLEFHELFSSDDRLVIRFTMTGVHNGEFMGVPATGKSIALPGITILHFADGRCIDRWSNVDMLGLLVQLGAVPPPA